MIYVSVSYYTERRDNYLWDIASDDFNNLIRTKNGMFGFCFIGRLVK